MCRRRQLILFTDPLSPTTAAPEADGTLRLDLTRTLAAPDALARVSYLDAQHTGTLVLQCDGDWCRVVPSKQQEAWATLFSTFP